MNRGIIALVDSVDLKVDSFCELHALVENKYEFTKEEKGRIALFNELLENRQMLSLLELCIPEVVVETREVGQRVMRLGIAQYISKPGYCPFKLSEFLELYGSIS